MIDNVIDRLGQSGEAVTLAALGGIEAITSDDEISPLFVYVTGAIVDEWGQLGAEDRAVAARHIIGALNRLQSGLALADVAKAVVPAAERLGIVGPVKDALRSRAVDRTGEETGALASIALRWLTHIAITAPEARHAILDVLTGVAAGERAEAIPFAIAASQMASVAYDHWGEASAKECLERLTECDGEADAWFGLGQARLVDALRSPDPEQIVPGLREALGCFLNAHATGEERPDAALYVNALRFISDWASSASAEILRPHLEGAEQALREYVILGSASPSSPCGCDRGTRRKPRGWT